MLDQNTDRMWYVIGAVIIGAALIFIMNSTFPQLFASVGDTFEGKTKETTNITDGIMPNTREHYLGEDDLRIRNAELVAYDEGEHMWTLNITPGSETRHDGFSVIGGRVIVPYGKTMTLSYEVFVPAGANGLYSVTDLNNASANPDVPSWSGNDNDDKSLRKYGKGAAESPSVTHQIRIPVVAGEWTRVWYAYTNSNALNVTKESLSDFTTFGVPNTTGSTIQIQIRHVKAEVN